MHELIYDTGHWIQACPTNNDPKFDGRYRVKRSTGIPRSLQKQVDKPDPVTVDTANEGSQISGVMVNADGDFVIAQPDKASWELYQEKVKASAAAAAESAAAESVRELQSRNLLCPVDKKIFVDPTKTPCCSKTYCNDCITNALIESDFVCPNCSSEGVLIDNLSADEEASRRMKEYEAERPSDATNTEKGNDIQNAVAAVEPANKATNSSRSTASATPKSSNAPTPQVPAKRPPEDKDEANTTQDTADTQRTKRQKSSEPRPESIPNGSVSQPSTSVNTSTLPFTSPAPNSFGPLSQPQFTGPTYPGGIMPVSSGFPVDGMNSMQGQYGPVGDGWVPMAGMNAMPQSVPYLNNYNGMPNPNFFQPNLATAFQFPQFGPSPMPQGQPYMPNMGMGVFSNQQRTAFSGPFGKDEDNAYLRQPVNPHRHQARQKRILRPSDYREL